MSFTITNSPFNSIKPQILFSIIPLFALTEHYVLFSDAKVRHGNEPYVRKTGNLVCVISKIKGATILKILKLLVWLFFFIWILFHNDFGYNIIKKRF